MCILLLVFEDGLGTDTRTIPYPLYFIWCPRHSPNYSRFIRISPSGRFRTIAPGRCLVPIPSIGIKLIYIQQIKQQERSYFRQLIVRVWDLRATYSMLDMLTYHFTSLSNPGQPHGCGCKDIEKVPKWQSAEETKNFQPTTPCSQKTLNRKPETSNHSA
jgi:hypothetical protein